MATTKATSSRKSSTPRKSRSKKVVKIATDIKLPRLHNEVYHDTSRCGSRKDGSIIKHDCWRADISVVQPDGTVKRVRRRFKTEAEARKFQNEISASKPMLKRCKRKSKKCENTKDVEDSMENLDNLELFEIIEKFKKAKKDREAMS